MPFRRTDRRRVIRSAGLLAVMSLAWGTAAGQPSSPFAQCRPAGALVKLPDLPEASGIAASVRVPGRLWAHNDSGKPVLFALDARGAVTSRVTVNGAKVEDWEAVAVGRCPAGSCVYVADIGDNDAGRSGITVYRIAEPDRNAGTAVSSEAFHATYPDGAKDAEALLVTPDGRLFVVTKGDGGPVALYAFPREMRVGERARLEAVGKPRTPESAGRGDRITDGAVSPDGAWVVLRTTAALHVYRAAEFFKGSWNEVQRIDLGGLGESQGEGVAFADGKTLYLASEGGGGSRPGDARPPHVRTGSLTRAARRDDEDPAGRG